MFLVLFAFLVEYNKIKNTFITFDCQTWDSYSKNETRKNVFETIIEKPGVTGKELSAKLGVDKSTIHWHINKLKEENSICCEKHGRFKRYYPKSNFTAIRGNKIPVFPE
ncbi:winged helix-turn-helix domain-containing protein [uncultured Methanolobus sp.]|uniref:winged helix-turn-helix domain-containing protein n=1 Tax=uncultured Methanolobus sp. TaxID=218300 RepID=UPI0029C90289|nr:winged helix-turn-helix domain-containing protein [uncultured Methanolobus sp.]